MFRLRMFAAKNSQKRSDDLASARNSAGSRAFSTARSAGLQKRQAHQPCRTYSTLTFNPGSARYLMYARGIGASRIGRPNFSSVMKTREEIFFLRFSFQMMTFRMSL